MIDFGFPFGFYSGNCFDKGVFFIYIYTHTRIHTHTNKQLIDQVGRVFANGPGDRDSTPGRVIPKTLKMVLDASALLDTYQA